MMWSRVDILAGHVRDGSIYDVRANDKFLCQRAEDDGQSTTTMAEPGGRCWCFSARAKPLAKKAKTESGAVAQKAGGQQTVWTEFVRSGSRSSALSKGGIEPAMLTLQNVVFSGDNQIKKASEALEKKQQTSLSLSLIHI